eukprot:758337-Hanusia_phi.AAC.1
MEKQLDFANKMTFCTTFNFICLSIARVRDLLGLARPSKAKFTAHLWTHTDKTVVLHLDVQVKDLASVVMPVSPILKYTLPCRWGSSRDELFCSRIVCLPRTYRLKPYLVT